MGQGAWYIDSIIAESPEPKGVADTQQALSESLFNTEIPTKIFIIFLKSFSIFKPISPHKNV